MPVKIFFCYAREDEALLNQLKRHLKPLQNEGLIEMWYDRHISPGADWQREITNRLDSAQIILLLLSPDFMASDYCYGNEMNHALERQNRGEARVIPIILRPVYWKVKPLKDLQVLPKDAKPVTSWRSSDFAIDNIVRNIQRIVEQMTEPELEEQEEPENFEDEEFDEEIEEQDDLETFDEDDQELEPSKPEERILKTIPSLPFPVTDPKAFSYIGTFPMYFHQLLALAISPNGDILVTVSDIETNNESTIRVWSLRSGALLNTFSQSVWTIAICPDNTTLVATGLFTILTCDLRTGQVINTYPGDPSGFASLALSPVVQTLATTGGMLREDQEIHIWNLQTGDLLNTLKGDEGEFGCVAFTPDGQTLLSAASDSPRIKAWNMRTGRLITTLKGQSNVQSLALSLNGQTLVSTGNYDDKSHHKIMVWDLYSEKQLKTIVGHPLIPFTAPAVSPDGQIVVCGGSDGKIKMWNPYSEMLLNTFQAHVGSVSRVVMSPDGHTLVTTGTLSKPGYMSMSRDEDEEIKVWGMQPA